MRETKPCQIHTENKVKDNITHPIRCKLFVDKPVEEVLEMEYFGMYLTRCGRLERKKLIEQVLEATGISGCFNRTT